MSQTSRPSIAHMVIQILIMWNSLSQEERKATGLLSCKEEELITYHHTLGANIRNMFQLWTYAHEPLIIDGIDCSPEHPDAVSMAVIYQVWKYINETEGAWKA